MTASSPLPPRQAVRDVVEGTIGRSVELSDGNPVAAAAGTAVTAVYVTDALSMAAIAVVDLPGAARLGGALGMLPRGGVDDAIHEKALSEPLKDNCYEVLNVLASVFNVTDAPHVRLYQLFGPGEAPPADVQALGATLGSRDDLSMSIDGYGPGSLSIVVR